MVSDNNSNAINRTLPTVFPRTAANAGEDPLAIPVPARANFPLDQM